ncbi:MAG: cellulase family glycosylhydrolase, partial [Myxococcales bacterium]|nr:cellulase family glycosylhydrolase [Myxococcales bacterium]
MNRMLAALACVGLMTATAAAGDLHVDGRWFKDAAGRVVILRGVNVAGNSKVPPFTPIDSAELLDPLADWGMNAIRLLFTWEAFEPAPGVYDEGYLDYYAQAVDWAWERGLRTIVDIHQDSFSRFTNQGCGEGFPRWAVASDVPTVEPDNSPENCADWGTQMIFDFPMHFAWNRFYSDAEGARTRYLAMIARIAERLGSRPGVAGIDLINEPWGLEDTEILALYEDAEPIVRADAPDW